MMAEQLKILGHDLRGGAVHEVAHQVPLHQAGGDGVIELSATGAGMEQATIDRFIAGQLKAYRVAAPGDMRIVGLAERISETRNREDDLTGTQDLFDDLRVGGSAQMPAGDTELARGIKHDDVGRTVTLIETHREEILRGAAQERCAFLVDGELL